MSALFDAWGAVAIGLVAWRFVANAEADWEFMEPIERFAVGAMIVFYSAPGIYFGIRALDAVVKWSLGISVP